MGIDLDRVAEATGGVHVACGSETFKPNVAYDKILKEFRYKDVPDAVARMSKAELEKFRTYALAKRAYGNECAEVDGNVVRQLNKLRDRE